MKNINKITFTMCFILLALSAHAELQHPTCKIHLANMNASLSNTTAINEAKKDSAIMGMIPRKITIAILKKYQTVDVNLMLERSFAEKGYITSFESDKEAANKGNFSLSNYKPKRLNSDYQSKDVNVNTEYYAEKMTASFGLVTMTKRKKYYNGFATVLAFSMDLKITDPMLPENKTSTFFKYTAEVLIKDGDVNTAFEDAITEALREAPRCEIL